MRHRFVSINTLNKGEIVVSLDDFYFIPLVSKNVKGFKFVFAGINYYLTWQEFMRIKSPKFVRNPKKGKVKRV